MSRTTVSRHTRRGGRRTPLTREQLLPLPATRARALALEGYLALETTLAGHGSADTMVSLLRAVYLSYVIDHLQGSVTPEPFREAELVLERCALRAKDGGSWYFSEEEVAVISPILAGFDARLARCPMHQYTDACARLQHLVSIEKRSPIPEP